MGPAAEIRLRLTLHYDGSGFHGWQVQPEVRTVQGELEAAAQRLTGGRRPFLGAGRTDTGVHATGQVAAVDVPAPRWDAGTFRRAMNAVLPDDVWIASAVQAAPSFHPRFDAVARTYHYQLGTAAEAFSPFHRSRCWALDDAVDEGLLRTAAARIPGERSFAPFAKSGQPERGERCRVEAARWERPEGSVGPRFQVTADRYLHRMVRYLVGTMVDVARGRRPPEEFETLLDDPGGVLETSPPAPPQGLFLVRVEYPPTEQG